MTRKLACTPAEEGAERGMRDGGEGGGDWDSTFERFHMSDDVAFT